MRIKLRLFAAVFFLSILAPLFSPLIASAALQKAVEPNAFKFIDRSVIVGLEGGQEVARYFDNKTDDDNTYKFSDPNGCVDAITNEDSDGSPVNGGNNYLWLNPNNSNEGGCKYRFTKNMDNGEIYIAAATRLDLSPFSTTHEIIRAKAAEAGDLKKINIGDRQKARINYYLTGENFIYSSDKNEKYKREGNSRNFFRTNDGDKCKDRITLRENIDVKDLDKDGDLQRKEEKDSGACENDGGEEPVFLGNVLARNNDGNDRLPQNDDEARTDIGTGEGTADSCESKGGALSWIMCPIIQILDEAAQWLDENIQNLLVVPNPQDAGSELQEAWGRIRNISLIILVPIMLVMVLATAVGSSIVDAYTVKRAMPRLFMAVLFISLSWYIMAFLVTLTNVVGRGIGGLITQPFGGFNQSLSQLISLGGGAGISAGSLAIFGGMILAGFVTFGIVMSFALIAVVALLIGFIVLTLRQILILALVLFAPFAVLGTIFPNTEKLWKMWWGNLSKLLLMFPLIVGLLAAGKAFAHVIAITGQSLGIGGIVKDLMVVVAYIAPFFFIPATFKAGGAVFGTLAGAIASRGQGVFERQKKFRQEKAAPGKERFGRKILQTRADLQNRLQTSASKRGGLSRLALIGAARGVGGYNIQGDDAARRAAVSEEVNKQIATGRDDEIRGLTVNKKTAKSRVKDGVKQYQTLGGGWVSEAAVATGQRRWGRDTYAQQAALSYEMRKANTEEDVQRIATGYADVAKNVWGQTNNQAGGTWIGAAFENQNQHLEYKYTDWKTGAVENGAALATEIYEKKGSYPLAQMHSRTIASLKGAYDDAERSGDTATMQQIQGIAETFMYRGGAGAVRGVGGEDEAAVAAAAAAASASPGSTVAPPGEAFQTSTPGAAHVAENVRDLAVHVGVYQPDLGSARTRSDQPPPAGPPGGPVPPPTIPRQN